MKQNKEVKISYWAHHLTTVVSVSLVLVLLGIISLIWISADKETRRLREQVELCAVMADSISDSSANDLAKKIANTQYARKVKVVSSEEALRQWTKATGEDLRELFGVNPLSPEISFTVDEKYANASSLRKIKAELEKQPGVQAVTSPDTDMIDAMNDNIERLTLILAIVAAVMLLISFVLINNTVHLTIYSRRFTIHTMQLVGATDGFIRRPIVFNNMLAGVIAGLFAAALFALTLACSREAGLPDMAKYIGWDIYGYLAAGLLIVGAILCTVTAWIAAGRYLHKDYDKLFR